MKINVKRIPEEGEVLQGSAPATMMELDDPNVTFRHEISYDLLAQIQENALLVTGRVHTPVTLRCSRCLEVFDQPLAVDHFVFHQPLQGEDFVDLTPHIREDIILELPQKALCEKECKGLCPVCGKNLNESACRCKPPKEDLRWHALDQLKLK